MRPRILLNSWGLCPSAPSHDHNTVKHAPEQLLRNTLHCQVFQRDLLFHFSQTQIPQTETRIIPFFMSRVCLRNRALFSEQDLGYFGE